MNKDNNITFLRLIAALLVLIGHCFVLSNGKHHLADPVSNFIRPYMGFKNGLPGIGVSLFFVVSGFLVTKSYAEKNNILSFIEARILRIYPALIAAVVFCVFCVGLFITTLPASDYLLHRETRSFLFINSTLIGIEFHLPGVFENNPWPRGVNGSLWTLPVELLMYCWVAILGVMGLLKEKRVFNLFFLLAIALYLLNPDSFVFLQNKEHMRLAIYFLFGSFFYTNADRIPFGKLPLMFFLILAILAFKTKYYDFCFALCFTYLVLFLSYSPFIKLPRMETVGDFSYGIYLYAYPVTQLLITYLGGARPYTVCMIALVLTGFLAILSWYGIEKPCLRLKGRLTPGLQKMFSASSRMHFNDFLKKE